MRKTRWALVAVLAFCGALIVGAAPEASAQTGCTTQGALALGLAAKLNIDATTTEAAIAGLLAINVQPDLGWKPEECLTPDVTNQVLASYAAAATESAGALDAGAARSALDALGTIDRQLHDVSPH